MNADRVEELRASFAELLSECIYPAGSPGRLRWLFDHLEEFLGRWKGFHYSVRIPIGDIVNTALHSMLLIGVDATDPEVGLLDGAENLKRAWRRFADVVRSVAATSDPAVAAEMGERLADARRELSRLLTATEDLK